MNDSQRNSSPVKTILGRSLTAAGGAVLGAGLAHFLDRGSGGARRARFGDRTVHLFREATRNIRRVSSHLSGRRHGVVPRLRNLVRYRPADDEILRERVRSKAGHFLSNPGALEVEAWDGIVTLGGDLTPSEAERLAFHVRYLPGVWAVRNRAKDPHFGNPEPPGPWAKESWTARPRAKGQARLKSHADASWFPAVRFSVAAVGASLAFLGLARLRTRKSSLFVPIGNR